MGCVVPQFLGITLRSSAFFIGALCKRHIKGLLPQEISTSFRSSSLTGENISLVQKSKDGYSFVSVVSLSVCEEFCIFYLLPWVRILKGREETLPCSCNFPWVMASRTYEQTHPPGTKFPDQMKGTRGQAAESLGSLHGLTLQTPPAFTGDGKEQRQSMESKDISSPHHPENAPQPSLCTQLALRPTHA